MLTIFEKLGVVLKSHRLKIFIGVLPLKAPPSRIPRLLGLNSGSTVNTWSTPSPESILRNTHLFAFVPGVQKFIGDIGVRVDSSKISSVLVSTFDCGVFSSNNRVLQFAKSFGISVDVVYELMIALDPYGICSAVRNADAELGEYAGGLSFYVGATTQSYTMRLKDHFRFHDTLNGGVLAEFDDFGKAAFAEFAGVVMARSLTALGTVKDNWNTTFGYDIPSIKRASEVAAKTTIYKLNSLNRPNPLKKSNKDTGTLASGGGTRISCLRKVLLFDLQQVHGSPEC